MTTRSELIIRLTKIINNNSKNKIIKYAIKKIIEYMAITIATGERIEIRGFGSFCLHYRAHHFGINPKNGKKIELEGKYIPYFKAGKKLKDIVI